ncbi:flagellar biosynthetic protein FliQ [Roseococcus sp. SDR]|uniref:flagellar biosynthetic protein FliQ n=1 Tax=Roseococcus sp. SDR TaxID=2835532 RepID=UPI001BCB9041|nr:flagellar biosynthetic protein FliQ [Roseococcus sp. SDR]MBS7788629.1 flagellar biosynthetic protein FliQ [Roseococcus sp. SDR]MBV1843943.1 flagellar biosynthetic protein FliQ [Roseococcus sp. SDR]
MLEQPVAMAMREALWVSLQLAGPPLLLVLAIGLAVSLLQALTQIQEATLAFLPKLAAIGGLMLVMGPWMIGLMQAWSIRLFDQVIALGGLP